MVNKAVREDPKLQEAVISNKRSLLGCVGHLLRLQSKAQNELPDEIAAVCGLTMIQDIPEWAAREAIKEYYLEKTSTNLANVIGEKWEVQQAWDKQNEFMKAQARAQSELRSLIKQYDEMMHKDWGMASEEQRSRIAQIKAQTDKLTGNNQEIEDMSESEAEIYGVHEETDT